MKLKLLCGKKLYDLEVVKNYDVFVIRWEAKKYKVIFKNSNIPILQVEGENHPKEIGFSLNHNRYDIIINGINYEVSITEEEPREIDITGEDKEYKRGTTEIKAQIPGLVTCIKVKEGQTIRKDQHLLSLDAMKLENEIVAPRNGVVKSIKVGIGGTVEKGDVLIELG
jgi:biotin carboxyl carrier protein